MVFEIRLRGSGAGRHCDGPGLGVLSQRSGKGHGPIRDGPPHLRGDRPSLFVACLPPLIRAGPEAYKGFLIEGVLIPLGTLVLACRVRKAPKRSKSLVWSPAGGWAWDEAR